MMKRDELVKSLQKFIAGANNQEMKDFTDLLVRVHLTHQQRTGQFTYYLLQSLYEYPHQDLRNEATKKFAEIASDATQFCTFPYI